MPTTAARTGLRRVPWWAWTLLGAAGVVAVVAALGGFAQQPISRVPTIRLGTTYHGQEVDTRVLGAHLMARAPGGLRSEKGAWLEIEAESINKTSGPVPLAAISFRTIVEPVLHGDHDADQVVLTRSGGAIADLQPGVRTRLAFLWQLPTGAIHNGDRIVVGLFEAVPEAGRTVTAHQYTAPDVKVRLQFAIGGTA